MSSPSNPGAQEASPLPPTVTDLNERVHAETKSSDSEEVSDQLTNASSVSIRPAEATVAEGNTRRESNQSTFKPYVLTSHRQTIQAISDEGQNNSLEARRKLPLRFRVQPSGLTAAPHQNTGRRYDLLSRQKQSDNLSKVGRTKQGNSTEPNLTDSSSPRFFSLPFSSLASISDSFEEEPQRRVVVAETRAGPEATRHSSPGALRSTNPLPSPGTPSRHVGVSQSTKAGNRAARKVLKNPLGPTHFAGVAKKQPARVSSRLPNLSLGCETARDDSANNLRAFFNHHLHRHHLPQSSSSGGYPAPSWGEVDLPYPPFYYKRLNQDEYPNFKKAARGASPDPHSTLRRIQANPTLNSFHFSYPTVPDPHHFPTSGETGPGASNLNFFLPQASLTQPSTSDPHSEAMHANVNHVFAGRDNSQSSSSQPSSAHISNRYRPDDWNIDEAMENSISRMCFDEYCTGRQCASCDSSCYEPCLNPEECSSVTCRNLSCIGSPMPTCADHHTPSTELFGDAANNRLYCDWLGNGVNCDQTEPTKNELGAHVTESHIKPQAQITCEWDSCGVATDVRSLPKHLWSDHEPVSYICLWSNCVQRFSTHEELDKHFKLVHCHIGCHWAGCEMVTMSQIELENHLYEEHLQLNGPRASAAEPLVVPKPTIPAPSASSQFEPASEKADPKSSPVPLQSSTKSNDEQESEMLGPKMCKWIKAGKRGHELCRNVHNYGNSLQEHIKEEHNFPPFTKVMKCGWEGCNYIESTGDRSKLWRHVAIHTKFALATCRCCRKEFCDKHRLEEHLRKTSKQRPLHCDTCGLAFTHQHALTIHTRTHTGEKPIKCEECDYTCSDPSNMSKHRKIHRPPMFTCEICGKPFCRKETLKRHMIVHDPNKEQIRRSRNRAAELKDLSPRYFFR